MDQHQEAVLFRLWINALAARTGGGITVLNGLVPALAAQPGVEVTVFQAPRDENGPERSTQHLQRSIGRSLLRRLAYEHLVLPRRAEGVDVFLGLSNVLPLAPPKSELTAVLIQNVAPLMSEVRRMHPPRGRPRFEALRFLTDLSIKRADVTFVFTRYASEVILDRIPDARVEVVSPGGTRSTESPRQQRTNEALVLADLYRFKGVEDVIRALADPRLRSLVLRVCGAIMDRGYYRGLQSLASDLGVAERVRFAGPLPHADAMRQLADALCLVHPSRVESLGLPLLEALSVGTPAVVADIPPSREIAGEMGRFYPPGDVATLADILVDISTNPAPSHHRPSTGGWDQSASRVIEILRKASSS